MTYKNMLKVLSHHDECYVAEEPSKTTMNKLKEHFGCDFSIRPATCVDTGYVVEKVKGGESHVDS